MYRFGRKNDRLAGCVSSPVGETDAVFPPVRKDMRKPAPSRVAQVCYSPPRHRFADNTSSFRFAGLLRAVSKPWVKRTVDICLAGLLLVGLSPLFGLVAGGFWMVGKEPVISKRRVVGQFGQPFDMLSLGSDPYCAGSSFWGRCFRQLRLHFVPRLWNVVLGDMSLVGPRPDGQAAVIHYPAPAFERLKVRPGMIGPKPADQCGRPAGTLAADLAYVRSANILTDLNLILQAILCMFTPQKETRSLPPIRKDRAISR